MISILFISFFIFGIYAENVESSNESRLKIHLEPKAFSNVSSLTAHYFHNYIKKNAYIPLPDQKVPLGILGHATLSNLKLHNMTFNSIDVSLADKVGITIDIRELSGFMDFKATYLLSVSSVANFTASTKLTLSITKDPTKDIPMIGIDSIHFEITHLKFDNSSGALDFLLDFTDEIASLISSTVKTTAPSIASKTNKLIEETPFIITQSILNTNVTLSVGLVESPVFNTTSGLTIALDGSALINATTECSLPSSPIPIVSNPSSPMQILISQSMVNCILSLLPPRQAANKLLQSLLEAVHFDHKLSLEADIDTAPTISFAAFQNEIDDSLKENIVCDNNQICATKKQKGGITVNASNLLGIKRVFGQNELFLSLFANVSASAAISLSQINGNVSVSAHVEQLLVKLGADPNFHYPKDFPMKYKKQIENTDFKKLDSKLATVLDSKIIPDLNKELSHLILPISLPNFLKNPVLEWHDKFLALGVSL